MEGEGGPLTGEEEVLQGGDTRVAGEGGLQVPEGGLHQEGGAGWQGDYLRLLKTESLLI